MSNNEPIFTEEEKNKLQKNTKWIRKKDDNGQYILTKENPLIGRLIHKEKRLKSKKYAQYEGEKEYVFIFIIKNEDGDYIKKKFNTSSDRLCAEMARYNVENDVRDFKIWYTQEPSGEGFTTTPHIVPYEGEDMDEADKEEKENPEKAEEPVESSEEQDVDIDDIQF